MRVGKAEKLRDDTPVDRAKILSSVKAHFDADHPRRQPEGGRWRRKFPHGRSADRVQIRCFTLAAS
jgi:hypothetical protein